MACHFKTEALCLVSDVQVHGFCHEIKIAIQHYLGSNSHTKAISTKGEEGGRYQQQVSYKETEK